MTKQTESPKRRPRGRPSSFKPEFVDQAEKLCALGATDIEIADFFEVDRATFYRWKAENREFCDAIKTGKEVADERVERSLFHRATGYSFDAVKIMAVDKAVEEVRYREHVPPDTTAAIFWLKNRRPDLWRDRRETELSGPGGAPIAIDVNDKDRARALAAFVARTKAADEGETS